MRTSFRQGKELETVGRLRMFLAGWLKAFEIEKLSDIEDSITDLENMT